MEYYTCNDGVLLLTRPWHYTKLQVVVDGEADLLEFLISLQNGGGGTGAFLMANRVLSAACGRDLKFP